MMYEWQGGIFKHYYFLLEYIYYLFFYLIIKTA